MVSLPPLPDPGLLGDLARETASQEDIEAWVVEKDFYLTRIIWGIAKVAGPRLLRKGGTLLSKVDLGYRRMSEDVDLAIPWDKPTTYRSANASQINDVRDMLRTLAPTVGLRLDHSRWSAVPSPRTNNLDTSI